MRRVIFPENNWDKIGNIWRKLNQFLTEKKNQFNWKEKKKNFNKN